VRKLHAVRTGRKQLAAIVPFVALLSVAGCGSSSSTSSSTTSSYAPATSSAAATASAAATSGVKLSAATVSSLGSVLVNSQGHTLYIFEPDNATKVTCVGSCAAVWPPVKVSTGTKAVPSGEVKAALISSAPDPEGGSVVTYDGWPLYTYVADSAPGTARGQAIQANGGYWYVISPSGTIIRKAP
jgi:predicted lipoprotein with Yx(FWY)xxD motif